MTVREIRNRYTEHHPDGYFFTKDTLKAFGERISEMRVSQDTTTYTDYLGHEHTAYVLTTIQRNHPLGSHRAVYYVDTETYDITHAF